MKNVSVSQSYKTQEYDSESYWDMSKVQSISEFMKVIYVFLSSNFDGNMTLLAKSQLTVSIRKVRVILSHTANKQHRFWS